MQPRQTRKLEILAHLLQTFMRFQSLYLNRWTTGNPMKLPVTIYVQVRRIDGKTETPYFSNFTALNRWWFDAWQMLPSRKALQLQNNINRRQVGVTCTVGGQIRPEAGSARCLIMAHTTAQSQRVSPSRWLKRVIFCCFSCRWPP